MPAKKKQPKKPQMTRQQRAAQIGISLQSLSNWERLGCDIWNDDDVRRKIARLRNLPTSIKPEWLPQTAPADVEPIDGSIDHLVSELHGCTDKHQAQTIKLKIDGLINAYKLRAAAGEYISRATHNEIMVRIGATFKAAITAMENELPPMLHGADMPHMQRTIRDKGDEVLRSLDEIYKQAHNDWQADV